ncbi:acid-sensing ion channel 2-like [Tubulanus polymorphus]|uniref:acid-sensing ion channel 2-like n=1 Tax=Tubulanus polymorphus TaxID=672921 RepID=UPI003DA5DA66
MTENTNKKLPKDCDDKRTTSSIKETVIDFSQDSSVHGIKYVGGYDVATIRKVTWIVMILGSISFCICMIHPRVAVYVKKPVSTKSKIEYRSPMPFPVVTICNMNALRLSHLKNHSHLQILAEKTPFDDLFLTDAIKQVFMNYTYDELLSSGGHKLNALLFECYWLNAKINCSDYFDETYTHYGRCFSFNSYKYIQRTGRKALEVTSSGSDQGLWVRIDIEQREYALTSSTSLSAGIKVLVHDQTEQPLIREYGLAIQPGVEALLGVTFKKTSHLPAPYEDGECRNTSDPNMQYPLDYFQHFSHSSCRRECLLKNIFEVCNCRYQVNDSNYEPCTLLQYYECVVKIPPARFDSECVNTCPVPCDVNSYELQLSTAMTPSNQAATYFKSHMGVTKEDMRENFIEMRVYFEQLEYENIYQVPEYEWQQLIADIGGQLGFCIGASILSVYELGEFVVIFVVKSCLRVRNLAKSSTEVRPTRLVAEAPV